MAKYKSIFIPARVVTAGRLRKCYHDQDHSVKKGENCLEVRVGLGWQGYCMECARKMLNLAQTELQTLSKEIS